MKISIITTTFNSAATIRDTLECISSQDYDDVEHIIVDGGSTDDTLDIVRGFPHVQKIISEKDEGIYDAMNKGITASTGDVIGILNSDDIYADRQVLALIAATFSQPGIMACYADLQFVQRDDIRKVVRTWKAGSYTKRSFYYGWMPPHPTFFVRREVYDRTGVFNNNLQSAADYELILRILLKHAIPAYYINKVIIKMRVGGMSTASFRNRIKANMQDRMAWKINNLSPHPFTLYLKPMRKLGQFFKK
ncbi:MAG: glycosyltransferase [Sphingobacteriales bacterium]|nr:glycosyltransferase [Sphingobacteriales bacterium]OJY81042.1 MAG: glycosyl transferase [Sphingobacteriales bacterium 44-15]